MTMYLEHFGLREAPFKITPHPEFFFSGANRGATLEALIYAVTSGEGIVKVTGEVGTGKTMLCRVLMERLPESVLTSYSAIPLMSPDDLLITVATDANVATEGLTSSQIVRALQRRLIELHGDGRRVVALIDEAHAMPIETLEVIRLLSNLETSHEKLIQMVLFGQPELDERLSMPNIRQLKERITHSFTLQPMAADDVSDYVGFRLRAAGYRGPDLFGAEVLKLISDASVGLSRRVNIYADKTLLAAYAANTHNVSTAHAKHAISDTQFGATAGNAVAPGATATPAATSRIFSQAQVGYAVAAALLVGALLGFTVVQFSRAPTAAPAQVAATPATAVATPTAAGKQGAAIAPIAPIAPFAPLAPIAPQPTAVGVATAGVASKIPATGEWLDKRISADVARVAALPRDRYTIQLLFADQSARAAIEAYLRTAQVEMNPDEIMLYPTGNAERPRVTVFYGNFGAPADAATALARLSTAVSTFRPYVRALDAIRGELRPVSR